jgi:biotin synthase-like enzyme
MSQRVPINMLHCIQGIQTSNEWNIECFELISHIGISARGGH